MKNRLFMPIYIIIIVLSVTMTFALYNIFKALNDNSEISSELSMYIDDEKTDTAPTKTSGYVFDHADCTNGAIITWDNTTWSAKINNLTASRTKCSLYFVSGSGPNQTLAKLQALNPSIALNTSMNGVSGTCPSYNNTTKTINTTGGEEDASLLCEAEDDFGPSYYFRGNVTNNYVSFAGHTWRILRINEDGSLRLIYDGVTPYQNIKNGGSTNDGTNRQIGTSSYNASFNDNAYLGYMYKASAQSSYANTFDVMNNKNATSSTIKGNSTANGSVDYWYSHNIDIPILSGVTLKYSDFVNQDTVFCNDKNIADASADGYTMNGYGTEKVAYRWYMNSSRTVEPPRFTCVNNESGVDNLNDAFSVSNAGNGALTYPVALVTTDEVVASGAYSSAYSHFLRTGAMYWTMTPVAYSDTAANMRIVDMDGDIHSAMFTSNDSVGVRPVISLKSDVNFAGGDGTMNNPFEVDYGLEIANVTYHNLTNSSYPTAVALNNQFTLNITENNVSGFTITMSGNTLSEGTDYTYQNNILTIPNVTGDLDITATIQVTYDYTVSLTNSSGTTESATTNLNLSITDYMTKTFQYTNNTSKSISSVKMEIEYTKSNGGGTSGGLVGKLTYNGATYTGSQISIPKSKTTNANLVIAEFNNLNIPYQGTNSFVIDLGDSTYTGASITIVSQKITVTYAS